LKPQWEPISEDLTDGIILASRYHVITTLDESPITEGKLYVGTVDANVWRSDNGGASWNNVSDGLPVRYVTSVKASPTDDNVVYVAHSGYKDNDFIPHIHRSGNGGEDWEDISSNLPALAINDIYILPNHQDSILFVATDGGVYGTMDAGESWERLGANMPYIPVYDMVWNEARNELVVGSFARSIMSYPIDSLLVQPMDTVVVNTEELAMPERPALNIYPSPATDMINLEFENIEPGKSYEVAIIDAQGRLVNLFEGDQQQGVKEQIDIAQLTAGWYTVKVKMRHEVKTSRFVKQ
jgi:hypothetical protein